MQVSKGLIQMLRLAEMRTWMMGFSRGNSADRRNGIFEMGWFKLLCAPTLKNETVMIEKVLNWRGC